LLKQPGKVDWSFETMNKVNEKERNNSEQEVEKNKKQGLKNSLQNASHGQDLYGNESLQGEEEIITEPKKTVFLDDQDDEKFNKKLVADSSLGVDLSQGDSGFIEKVISINRITKVTKGGKKLSFSALVVVGDAKGNVGYSLEKASEVSIAIRKAMLVAKKNMIRIPLKGTTITHEIIGHCGGARVLLKPASEGTGVIAAGPVRAVCDGAGIRNILTKCHKSNNPINVVKATMDGLSRLKRVG